MQTSAPFTVKVRRPDCIKRKYIECHSAQSADSIANKHRAADTIVEIMDKNYLIIQTIK